MIRDAAARALAGAVALFCVPVAGVATALGFYAAGPLGSLAALVVALVVIAAFWAWAVRSPGAVAESPAQRAADAATAPQPAAPDPAPVQAGPR